MKKGKKQFYCELFDTHDWRQYGPSFQGKDGLYYIHVKCILCRKKKIVLAPTIIGSLSPYGNLEFLAF